MCMQGLIKNETLKKTKRYGRTDARRRTQTDNLKTQFAKGGCINIVMKITHANILEFKVDGKFSYAL